MKNKYCLYFIILIIFVVGLFVGRGCKPVSKEYLHTPFNRDSAMKVVRADVEKSVVLHKISEQAERPAIEYRDRWHASKQDTNGVPYIQIINLCDSVISKHTAYENALCNELGQAYKVISSQNIVITGDSTNYAALQDTCHALRKAVKKERRWKNFWKVMFGVSAAANVVPR